jgi:DUF2950 family protein
MIPRLCSLAAVAVIALALSANAQTPAPPAKTETPTKSATPAAKPEAPAAKSDAPATATKNAAAPARRFASPEEATAALVTALRGNDARAALGVLGSEGQTLLISGDPVVDQQSRVRFLTAYDAAHTLQPRGEAVVLRVGKDDWPFPVPLVKDGSGRWFFDAAQGREEIIARRIGRNEIYTMQTALAYVDAQREYYAQDHNGNGLLEYAQYFASSVPGKRDGLYWPTQPGEPPSPLGDLVVRARAEGYRRSGDGPTPYHGYLYRILTAQGPAAAGGAYDYVIRGHMIAGFALVAFPAEYGVSGVMTFIVNHDGVVYQKDLGPRTRSLAFAMRTFNPDGTWTKVDVPEVAAPDE